MVSVKYKRVHRKRLGLSRGDHHASGTNPGGSHAAGEFAGSGCSMMPGSGIESEGEIS